MFSQRRCWVLVKGSLKKVAEYPTDREFKVTISSVELSTTAIIAGVSPARFHRWPFVVFIWRKPGKSVDLLICS